jgi:hypothetical protein
MTPFLRAGSATVRTVFLAVMAANDDVFIPGWSVPLTVLASRG